MELGESTTQNVWEMGEELCALSAGPVFWVGSLGVPARDKPLQIFPHLILSSVKP